MRRVAMTLMAAMVLTAAGGCVTIGGGGSSIVTVNTSPPGALLTIDGAGECETPCTIKLDGPRQAKIAKAGFVAVTTTLAPGRKSVTIPLELAAASEDVDTLVLPDLN